MKKIGNRPLPPIPSKPSASNVKLQPIKPVSDKPMVVPPKLNANESSWSKFKKWLSSNRIVSSSLGALSRLEILNKYKDYLMTGSKMAEAVGYGKKRKMGIIKDHNKLCSCIHQHGGSWSDFVGWIKNRANDVANVGKRIGNAVASAGSTIYRRAIRPAYDYAKDHPVSAIGAITKGLSYIPSPFSVLLEPLELL
jgi:hypothetical protein